MIFQTVSIIPKDSKTCRSCCKNKLISHCKKKGIVKVLQHLMKSCLKTKKKGEKRRDMGGGGGGIRLSKVYFGGKSHNTNSTAKKDKWF